MTYHAVDCPDCEYRYGLGVTRRGAAGIPPPTVVQAHLAR
jgi:hypothetical protein